MLMPLARKASLAVVLLLLTSVGTAPGACAWVLWAIIALADTPCLAWGLRPGRACRVLSRCAACPPPGVWIFGRVVTEASEPAPHFRQVWMPLRSTDYRQA
jgi:hypothetical protein